MLWIDLENTPQVLFLEPILRWAHREGIEVEVTGRPHGQTVALAKARGINLSVVGDGNQAANYGRVRGALNRIRELRHFARRHGVKALVSSSRSAAMAARSLGIPSIGIMDYEHSLHWPLVISSKCVLLPDLLSSAHLPFLTRRRSRFFPGLKENLYLDHWQMSREATRRSLGITSNQRFVLARPPAESAHYSTDLSTQMWVGAARKLLDGGADRFAIMARDEAQASWMSLNLGSDSRIQVLPSGVQGPELVNAADLVLGGGGTMNREAAVLGTPVWSTFCGTAPYIDECLAREGRLTWIRAQQELDRVDPVGNGRGETRGPFPRGMEIVLETVKSAIYGRNPWAFPS